GSFPVNRNPGFRRQAKPGDPKLSPEEEAQQKWHQAFWQARSRYNAEAEAIDLEESRNDWRPVCSYPSNLVRIGDLLLNTDAAWVTFGKAVERPRAAFGPAVNQFSGGRPNPALYSPPNDRVLADRMAWQFPWYWSGGVLAGLLVLSMLILTK